MIFWSWNWPLYLSIAFKYDYRQRILANPEQRESTFLPLEPQQGLPPVPANGDRKGAKGGGKNKSKTKSKGEGDQEVKEKEPPLPKYNKKVASKITALTSKSTDVRCLQTSISASTLL